MQDGTEFFNTKSSVFNSYLNLTDQKHKTAIELANAIQRNFDNNQPLSVLCIGGGDGQADLECLLLSKEYNFVVDNIDSSKVMCELFRKKATEITNVELRRNSCHKFELFDFGSKTYDLIFCINSIYFLKTWKDLNNDNALLSMYALLKPSGLAAVVLKSKNSDHYKIKNLLDAGHTTGQDVRKILTKFKIPHYWEDVDSEIDVTSILDSYQKPELKGNVLLDFFSKGNWNNLPDLTKNKVINEIVRLKVDKGEKSIIKSKYELVWLRKRHVVVDDIFDKSETYKTKTLAKKISQTVDVVKNFPIDGIFFRDTSRLLKNPGVFKEIIKYAADKYRGSGIETIVSKDMQGVLWAGALAKELGVGIVPMFRKDIAPPFITAIYEHEYNPHRILNLKKSTINKGTKVLIVDYIIATGSTIAAESMLVEHLGGIVEGVFSVMELSYLNPRKLIGNYNVHTILKYAEES